MFGKFNEATQLKTSLAKKLMKFNDLAVQMRPHRIAYLRLNLHISEVKPVRLDDDTGEVQLIKN